MMTGWDFQAENFVEIPEREVSISPSSFDWQLPDNIVTYLCPIQPVIRLFHSRWYVGHGNCCFGFCGFWWKWAHSKDERRHSMVRRWWWALILKNVNLSEWGGPRFIYFLGSPLDVLELHDHKRGVLRREWGIEICEETYPNV